MIAVGGFSLAHFGKLYSGQESYGYQVTFNCFSLPPWGLTRTLDLEMLWQVFYHCATPAEH
jgi:hypothetical protein